MLKLSTAGFGLVAALAWNEFIKESFNIYVKPYAGELGGTLSLLIYALLATVLAVVVVLNLTKLKENLEE